MAYLGSGMEEVEKTVATCNMVCDTMTGNGSLTTMTIGASQEMPGHVNNVSIYFDGVAQRPATDYTLNGKTVTFTTAPEDGVKVVCLSYASEYLDVISDATVYGSEILDGAITDAKIASGISASKLSGALPAIDGSAVLNFSPRGVVKNASDPAIDTNHANGVGTVWANTTSGEMYVCTDAAAGANVWTNIGSGSGDVVPYSFQGTVSGYTSGGRTPNQNIIDKHSFTSDGNSVDHGDLHTTFGYSAGQSSTTYGYIAGVYPNGDTIGKFAFVSNVTGTDVGNLTVGRDGGSGHNSETHGFTAGGFVPSANNTIDKFTFATDGNATDVGDLSQASGFSAGQSSETHGYHSGGTDHNSNGMNFIEKFGFATNNNASDIANLTVGRKYIAGQSSSTHGYSSGGHIASPTTNVIDRFTFASDNDAVDVGDLTGNRGNQAGQSATTHGYCGGGSSSSNVIEKFQYAATANATDVGDITVGRYGPAGQQY